MWWREIIPKPYSKKSKLSISLDQQSKVLWFVFILGAVPRVFWAYRYMYRDRDFNESTAKLTVGQTDRQKLWLYLAAF